jgi:hypothetical protein
MKNVYRSMPLPCKREDHGHNNLVVQIPGGIRCVPPKKAST